MNPVCRINLFGAPRLLQIIRTNSSQPENKTERPESFADEEVEPVRVNVNKSGLTPQHRNVLHEVHPYREPHSWIHLTEKYQRKIYGLYGTKSNVNPKICFDAKNDAKTNEINRITQSESLQQLLENARKITSEKLQSIKAREDDIAKKLEKLELWKQELNAKIAKRNADALAAKQRKERIVEEVRRHFGFKLDIRDERFKEMLEQKEKEDKRKQKEAKRKAKEEMLISKLIDKKATAS